MSQVTETITRPESSTLGIWPAAIIGGLIASVIMGGMLLMKMRGVLAMAIPAMYGIEGPALLVGFGLHLFHGAVLALGFAALAHVVPGVVDSIGKSLVAGVGYGILVWVVAAAIVMPIWLSTAGFPQAPPLPNFNPMSLIAHIVYGAVLGSVVAVLR